MPRVDLVRFANCRCVVIHLLSAPENQLRLLYGRPLHFAFTAATTGRESDACRTMNADGGGEDPAKGLSIRRTRRLGNTK